MAKLKKLAALLLSGAMCVSFAFAFTACDDDGTESGSQNSEQTDDGNADADTGNDDGGSSDGESGNESSGNTDTESGDSSDGGQSDGDAEDSGNAETDDTYYGKTYTVDYSALDCYVNGELMSEDEKAEYNSSSTSSITPIFMLTLYEDGTGIFTQEIDSRESVIDVSFNYVAVECTQLTYTFISGYTCDCDGVRIYSNFFEKSYTRDFTGIQFKFSDCKVTKYVVDGIDYLDLLTENEPETIDHMINAYGAFGYDGNDIVFYYESDMTDFYSIEYFYEEATGNYYYFDDETGDYYRELLNLWYDDCFNLEGYTFGVEFRYTETDAIAVFGALKAAE